MYTYVFIRTDIPIHAQLVQSCHAALEMGLRLNLKDESPSNLILLAIKDEAHLEQIKYYLDMNEIENYMFFEPDYDMGFTSICTEPIQGDRKKLFKKFNLWKHNV